MKSTRKMFKALVGGEILILGFALAAHAMAQAPTLTSSTFYGGAGDQRGAAISEGGGALYISGNVQPETGGPGDTALVLKYALPSGPSPVWARSYGFGTNFYGVAATNEGVYADGRNYSLTTDGVGGKEAKSILAKFAPDGSTGPAPGGAIWLAMPHFFAYTGGEYLLSATTAVEGGSTFIYAAGGGQPCSYGAYVIAKFDTSGNLLAKATDPGQENAFNFCFYNGIDSVGWGVTVLNGNVYAVGSRGGQPAIWKHAPNLSVVWRQQDTGIASGQFLGVAAFGGDIYAVGHTYAGPNSEDYLIDKYDEAGTLLWSRTSGGANTDVLTGVVGIGTRLFAVGYTQSSGAGGADSVVLEIDPATGVTLSTTLFGGPLDDRAYGTATDGTDLYVVGESRSFASTEGNTVGQNDVMLLRYTFGPSTVCGNGVVEGAEQCDDGNTTSGDCCSTICQYEAAGTSCGSFSDAACDNLDTCNATGVCQANNEPNGNSCSDGNACTTADTCSAGVCVGGTALNVDDSNPCTDDSCNTASGAVHTNNTASCSDGNACTTGDACSGGTCLGTGTLNVDDGNICTTDSCNPATGPVHVVDTHCAGCVGNAPPVVTGTTASDPMTISGGNANVSATFTDAPGQTHTCSISWGDGSPDTLGIISETNGSGTCTGSHSYAAQTTPVVYEVTITVTDDCGGAGNGVTYVVLYDPNGGFVTGGGWINSPAGAYPAQAGLAGKANFGFVSKYQKNSTVPTGNTQFHFNTADFRFDSDSYEWLVISGAKARYRGTGSVNGVAGYGFELTAWDGQVNGGDDVDKFRIKIWNQNQGNGVVYDNMMGASDGTDPITVLGGGSIVIHKK
jgi:cysteine-rich repeat protein